MYGAGALQVARVENQLIGAPGFELRQGGQHRRRRPVPRPCAGQCEVRLERPGLGLQPGRLALGLHPPGQRAHRLVTGPHAQPDHTRQPAPAKHPHLAERDLERRTERSREAVGDSFRDLLLDASDEAQGEMKVVRAGPSKLGREIPNQLPG